MLSQVHGNSCIGDLCYIKVELNDSRSTLFTDIVLTVLVLAGITIFCSSCRVVAKSIHGNSCIGDLCYIKVELNDSRSTLFTDIVLTVLVLAGMTIFCSSCRVVAKPIHGNSCIGDLCYIKVELNDSRSTLFTDIVLTVLVLAGMTIFCSSCRVVAKPIHGNSCIGDLCYIKVELKE